MLPGDQDNSIADVGEDPVGELLTDERDADVLRAVDDVKNMS